MKTNDTRYTAEIKYRIAIPKSNNEQGKALLTSTLDLNLMGSGGYERSAIFGTRRSTVLKLEQ